MRPVAAIVLVGISVSIVACAPAPESSDSPLVVVGSKTFTESVVLGEIVTQLARSTGSEAQHLRQLGGTRILWNALLAGEIDVYVEYTALNLCSNFCVSCFQSSRIFFEQFVG